MIITLLALASASLFGLLGLIVYLFRRVSHLEAQQALTKASLLAQRQEETREPQADDIFDEESLNALQELVDFLRYNNGDLREGLDTYFTGALDDTHIQEELQEAINSINELEQQEFQDFEEVQIAVQDKLQEIFQEISERLER